MATFILTNRRGITNLFKTDRLLRKKEFSMMRMIRKKPFGTDIVSSKQRLSIPFSYKWLKLKTGFFGLVLARGIIK